MERQPELIEGPGIRGILEQQVCVGKKDYVTGEEINIPARTEGKRSYVLERPGQVLRYEFFVKDKDIKFKIIYRGKEYKVGATSKKYCSGEKHKGVFKPHREGTVDLVWDNSYSLFNSKQVNATAIVEAEETAPGKGAANRGSTGTAEAAPPQEKENVPPEREVLWCEKYERRKELSTIQRWGTKGFLTHAEDAALEAFRSYAKVEDIEQAKIPFEPDDCCLLRFLRARKFDLEKSKEMWDGHQVWRQESQVNAATEMSDKELTGLELSELCELLPTGYKGQDRWGRPIMIKTFGHCNLKKLLRKVDGNSASIVLWEARNSELLKSVYAYHSYQNKRHIENFFGITDLEGFGFSQITDEVWKMLRLSNHVTSNNFPESLGALFVINAPWYFRGVWTVLKTFVDARTISKFTILGSDYQKTLHKHVEPSNLPVDYGGTGLLGVSKLSDLHSNANGYAVFGTAKTFVREQKGRPHAGSKKERRRAPSAKQDAGRVISAGTDDAEKAGKSMGTWIDHKGQKATNNPLFMLK